MMKLPFAFENTEQVRKEYCEMVVQTNLTKALEAVLREVETAILFTNETQRRIDFSAIAQKYTIDEHTSGLPDGSTPMLVYPSIREKLLTKIREGFPTSTVTMEFKESAYFGGRNWECLIIDWTPMPTLD